MDGNTMIQYQDILGYRVVKSDLTTCIDSILKAMLTPNSKEWLACINPHSYAIALEDKNFSEALHGANLLIPDGSGIVLASHVLGGGIDQRITGSDIFFAINSRANENGGLSVFFLGATPSCLDEIRVRMAKDYPNIRFAGCYSPPYQPNYNQRELDEMISAINRTHSDILWVGMTAPKQEKWIHQNLHRLDVRFAAAIGAVFDFYVGRIKRSPPIFQKLGLEWLPRLLQEPKRLWRRMFVSAPIFLLEVVIALIRRKKPK